MQTLDLNDIQGLLVRAYADLVAARYLLVTLPSANAGRSWLASIASEITPGNFKPKESAVNIALTFSGVQSLQIPARPTHSDFSQEFISGMAQEHRSRAFGDTGDSAPANWAWGGPQSPVDAIILLFAKDSEILAALDQKHRALLAFNGISVVKALETSDLGGREHFGFRDGISQPIIEGMSKRSESEPAANLIKSGEFILGYPNQYSQYTERPMVQAAEDPRNLLSRDTSGAADLGRNGTYIVLRTLQQDVIAFNHFLDEKTKDATGASNTGAQELLAAKMVGRWRSGAPTVLTPTKDDPALANSNDFAYQAADPLGMRCPIGAHIRRANTRDSLDPNPGSDQSIAITNHHRILRRGREYGPPVTPAELADPSPPPLNQQVDRGLHFLCFAGNISRQFEFLQHTWLNNPKFDGLYEDADPLIGSRDQMDEISQGGIQSQSPMGGTFTIPANPLRKRLTGLPRFVVVRGGAYFFMPGIAAIKYIGALTG